MTRTVLALCAVSLLAGCATAPTTGLTSSGPAPEDIPPAQVSTSAYASMNCGELETVSAGLSTRGLAAVNSGNEAEIALVKGEIVAFQTVNTQKNCGIIIG